MRMREDFTDEWPGVMAHGEEFMRRKISTDTVYG